MKTLLIALCLLTAAPAWAGDRDWTATDTALQVTYSALHLVDWAQTRQISRNPSAYRELNPLIGEHPSTARVDLYMGASAVLHPLISYALPRPYREVWLGSTLAIKIAFVAQSFRIGLSGGF